MIKLQNIIDKVIIFFWNSFLGKSLVRENVGGILPLSLATCKISGMQTTHTVGSASAVVDIDANSVSCAKFRP